MYFFEVGDPRFPLLSFLSSFRQMNPRDWKLFCKYPNNIIEGKGHIYFVWQKQRISENKYQKLFDKVFFIILQWNVTLNTCLCSWGSVTGSQCADTKTEVSPWHAWKFAWELGWVTWMLIFLWGSFWEHTVWVIGLISMDRNQVFNPF